MLKKWQITVDIVTFIWLITFLFSLFTKGETKQYLEYTSYAICILFIIDLIVIYKLSKSIKYFLKNHWFDILLAIPFFRIFRFAKIGKLLRVNKSLKSLNRVRKSNRIIESLKSFIEMVDLSTKTKERIKKRTKKPQKQDSTC